ncbi:hypothetical protein NQ315_013243 [Exocentrus adspersus]|uniref:Uncharacterized protein n=1 Tax=Exocentrus adspersus TaxID=1586481 RepID=A0AAV8V776_9CUCU|nr:hypothetical protein NQ315_013243 [Exocentrus adspersus]
MFKLYFASNEEAEVPETAEDPGAWEENFKSHHDSKPKGPSAVGFDVTFPEAIRIYGLPEHADSLALRTTGPGGLDPYRLYNLDVFEYEMDSGAPNHKFWIPIFTFLGDSASLHVVAMIRHRHGDNHELLIMMSITSCLFCVAKAGIWLPFYRAHAHIDTRRREPYLFSEDIRNRIRTALRLRYAHLPLWYTLFWEHETNGDPIIRPLFYQYPEDEAVLDIDNELLVGGPSEYWYDVEDYKLYQGTGNYNLPVSLDKNVAFYRGGSIIPRKDRPRRSASLMRNDPFTLYVALDSKKTATGNLYLDDNESFEYRNKKYLYLHFAFKDNTLTSR